MPETGERRPRLSEDVEALAEHASSRGAVRRAHDLRAIAEHLRAKERRVVVDVRPEALARRRAGVRGRLRRVLGRLRGTGARRR
jgi:hypothetical protein